MKRLTSWRRKDDNLAPCAHSPPLDIIELLIARCRKSNGGAHPNKWYTHPRVCNVQCAILTFDQIIAPTIPFTCRNLGCHPWRCSIRPLPALVVGVLNAYSVQGWRENPLLFHGPTSLLAPQSAADVPWERTHDGDRFHYVT